MLRYLNRFVVNNLKSSDSYFTMAAARFKRTSLSVQFAGAGHPPAIIVSPGKPPRLLESNSMILGLFDAAVSLEATIETAMHSGDRLLIYTDGLTERFNLDGDMLGVDGLAAIVRDTSTLGLAQMKQEILTRVNAWSVGPAADDVSLVAVEIT